MKKWFSGFLTFVIATPFLFAGPVITKPLFAGDGPAGKTSVKKKGNKPEKTDPGKKSGSAKKKTGKTQEP